MPHDDIIVPGYNHRLRGSDDLSKAIPQAGNSFPLQRPKPKPLTENEKALKELEAMNANCGFIYTFPMPESGPSAKQQERLERHKQEIVDDVSQKHERMRRQFEEKQRRRYGGEATRSCRELAEQRRSVDAFGGSLSEILEPPSEARERKKKDKGPQRVHRPPGRRDTDSDACARAAPSGPKRAAAAASRGDAPASHGRPVQRPTDLSDVANELARQIQEATARYSAEENTALADLLGLGTPSAAADMYNGIVALEQAIRGASAPAHAAPSPSPYAPAPRVLATSAPAPASVSATIVPSASASSASASRWPTEQPPSSRHDAPRETLRVHSIPFRESATHEPEVVRRSTARDHVSPERDRAPESRTDAWDPTPVRSASPVRTVRPYAPFATTGSEAPAWRPSRRLHRRSHSSSAAPATHPQSTGTQEWEITDFSYENLLELGSMAVCVGLTKQQIARIPKFRHAEGRAHGVAVPKECTVCLEPFAGSDVCMALACQHVFHEECISPWLLKSKQCPCCRHDVARVKSVGYTGVSAPYQPRPV